jgi:hypothetical protein
MRFLFFKLLTVTIFFANNLIAQSRIEVGTGLNYNPFFYPYLSQSYLEQPFAYRFQMKRAGLADNIKFRASLNYGNSKGYLNNQRMHTSLISVGIETPLKIFSLLRIYGGVDGIAYYYHYTISQYYNYLGVGIGPILGLQYNLTKRISLSSEAGIGFSYRTNARNSSSLIILTNSLAGLQLNFLIKK